MGRLFSSNKLLWKQYQGYLKNETKKEQEDKITENKEKGKKDELELF